MAKYMYVGDGAGVPGLPHVVSEAEAEALGVAYLLAEAIKNGSYVPVKGIVADDGKKGKEKEVKNGQ